MSREFVIPSDLSPFAKEAKRFLQAAHDLGWSLRWGGKNQQMVTAYSPDRTKQIHVPKTSINANRMHSWVRALVNYTGDSEKVEKYIEDNWDSAAKALGRPVAPRTKARQTAFGVGVVEGVLRTGETITLDQYPPEVADSAEEVVAQINRTIDQAVNEERQVRRRQAREQQDTTVPAEEKTLITERPWMARSAPLGNGSGTMYESHAVLQRTWSDGSETYHCKFCDFEREAPRSVTAHASKAHPENPAPKKPRLLRVEHYEGSGITQKDSGRRRLRADLLSLLDNLSGEWQEMDAEDLAAALTEGLYDMRPERAAATPLTSDQIIDRIALLVDGGRVGQLNDQMNRLAGELVSAREEVAAAQAAAAEAEAEAIRLREERRALASMLREE